MHFVLTKNQADSGHRSGVYRLVVHHIWLVMDAWLMHGLLLEWLVEGWDSNMYFIATKQVTLRTIRASGSGEK